MNTTTVAQAIQAVNGVASVSEWTRVVGRERVYFGLTRYNGVSHELIAGQVGVEGWVDATGAVFTKGGAHNASLSYHRDNGTFAAIKAAAARALAMAVEPELTMWEEAEKEDWIGTTRYA